MLYTKRYRWKLEFGCICADLVISAYLFYEAISLFRALIQKNITFTGLLNLKSKFLIKVDSCPIQICWYICGSSLFELLNRRHASHTDTHSQGALSEEYSGWGRSFKCNLSNLAATIPFPWAAAMYWWNRIVFIPKDAFLLNIVVKSVE